MLRGVAASIAIYMYIATCTCMQQFRPHSFTAKNFVATVSKPFDIAVTQEMDRILDSYDILDIRDTWLVRFEAHV